MARTYINLAVALGTLGRLEEAADVYLAALQRYPEQSTARRNLVNALRDLGPTAHALAATERLATLAPTFPPARKLLAQLYAQMGRPEDALREYRVAAELDPRDAEVQRRIGALGGGPP